MEMEDIKRVQLSEIAGLITKGTTPTTLGYEFQEDGVNFLKIECFDENGGFIESKVAHISEECNEKLKRSQLKAGDVLFSIAGAIGRVAIVTEEMLPANTNQALAIIRIADEQVYLPYIKLILTSPIVIEQFEKKKQGVAQLNLSLKDINEIFIPLPCKEKQIELAELFDKVAGVIAKRKTEISALDDLIKARFVEMMESTELSDETSIENITERVKVGFVGTCEKFYTDELGVPMLRTGNITENGIDLSDLKYVTEEFHEKNKKSQIHEGDLLIARHGSNGQANVYTGPEAQCLNAVVIVPNEDIACSVFLAGLINSPTVKAQIEKTLVGSTQHVVNTKSIASLKVKIPNLTVQKQYCDFVHQVDKSKVAVQKALDEAQMLFDSLMQEYIG